MVAIFIQGRVGSLNAVLGFHGFSGTHSSWDASCYGSHCWIWQGRSSYKRLNHKSHQWPWSSESLSRDRKIINATLISPKRQKQNKTHNITNPSSLESFFSRWGIIILSTQSTHLRNSCSLTMLLYILCFIILDIWLQHTYTSWIQRQALCQVKDKELAGHQCKATTLQLLTQQLSRGSKRQSGFRISSS